MDTPLEVGQPGLAGRHNRNSGDSGLEAKDAEIVAQR